MLKQAYLFGGALQLKEPVFKSFHFFREFVTRVVNEMLVQIYLLKEAFRCRVVMPENQQRGRHYTSLAECSL